MSKSEFLQSDRRLDADITKAGTFEDLRALLENAVERSPLGVTRDPQTGQFVRRDPLAAAAQTVEPEEVEQVTETRTIGGREFTFTGSALDVEKQIGSALQVAEALKTAPIPEPVAHVKTQAERDLEVFNRTELELKFRRGEISSAEFLDKSGAVGEYLAEKGFDVDAAAEAQQAQSWAQACDVFLHSPAGADWPGGAQNLQIIGMELTSHPELVNAEDKVAAIAQAYQYMKEKHLLFDPGVSQEQILRMADQAKTPGELIETFKDGHSGDAEAANQAFIEAFRNGRQSSGIFGR